jgi:general stress protein 26
MAGSRVLWYTVHNMEKNEAIKQEALDFLKKHIFAVVASITGDNMPNAATVLYHIDDDMNLFFMTRKETRKFENLMTNGRVAAVVGLGDGPGTVQMEGVARLVEKGEDGLDAFFEHIERNAKLKELYYGPFLLLPGIDLVVFRVQLSWMRYLHVNTDTQTEEYYRIVG